MADAIPRIRMWDGTDRPCPLCEFERRDDIDVIYRDRLWSAYVAPPIPVPGWVVLQTRRHDARGLVSFTEEEAATLGRMQRAVARAIEIACEAERVVEIFFGFSFEHYHTLLAPMTEYPDDLSGLVAPFANQLPPVAQMFDDGRHKLLYSAVSPSATPDPAAVRALLPVLRRSMNG